MTIIIVLTCRHRSLYNLGNSLGISQSDSAKMTEVSSMELGLVMGIGSTAGTEQYNEYGLSSTSKETQILVIHICFDITLFISFRYLQHSRDWE